MKKNDMAVNTFSIDVLDSLTAHIAILNAQGVIVSVNKAWQQFGAENGLLESSHSLLGSNYLNTCKNAINQPYGDEASAAQAGIAAVLTGEQDAFYLEYPCHSPSQQRWFFMSVLPLQDSCGEVIVSHENITERKLMEIVLRDSESYLNAILDASPVAMGIIDTQDNITYLNQAFMRTFGYTLNDIPTLADWWPRAYPDPHYQRSVIENWQNHLAEAIRSNLPFVPMELNITCKNGDVHTFIVGASALKNNFANTHLVTLYDITERKFAEKKLAENEFIMATVLENVSAYIYMKDCSGRYTFVNKPCLDLWGLPIEKVIGVTDEDLFDPQFAAAVRDHDRRVLVNDKSIAEEEIGKTATYWAVKIPLHDDDGSIYGLCGISTDITALKEMDKEIRSSKAKMEAALASMTDAVFISDANGRLIEFNNAFATFHKFRNKEECPKMLSEYPHILDIYSSSGELLPLEQRVVPCALRGETGTGVELTLRRKDTGETWTGSYNYAPIRNDNDVIVGAVVNARDITEQKKAIALLRENEEKMRLFIHYSPSAIAMFDCDMRYLAYSRRWLTDYGLAEQNLIGRSHYDVFPDIPERWKELHRRGLAGSNEKCERDHFLRADGSVEWVRWEMRPWLTNTIGGIILFTEVITERVKIEQTLSAREKEFRLLAESMPQIVWITLADGECIYLNQQWIYYTGLSLEESYGRNWNNAFHPNYQQRAWDTWCAAVKNKSSYSLEDQIRGADGVYRWWLTRAVPVFDETGKIYKWFGTCTDIHDIKEAEKVLREKERLLADSQAVAHIGSWMMDINTGTIHWSEEAFRLYGVPLTDTPPEIDHFFELLHPDDRLRMKNWLETISSGKQASSLEFRTRPVNGSSRDLLRTGVLETDANGKPLRIIGTVQDITERKKSEETIYDLAYYDPLTHQPNRRLMLNRLKQALISSKLKSQYGAILFMDLNNFKMLNDTKGHDIGDLLLIEVSLRLNAAVHEDDTVARTGGNEFVVLLDGLDRTTDLAAAQAETVAKRLLASIGQPFDLRGYAYRCSASIGIVLFHSHEINVDELVKYATMAMHQAKQMGKNTIRFFDPAIQEALEFRVQLESWMHKALNEQYELYYQIQVDDKGNAIGAETLIRWHHPEKGMISPADFIPLAEETGLILPIGQWVLETACTQLKAWEHQQNTEHLVLAVNVSAKQFAQKDFVKQVLVTLEKTGANPNRLKLELTESMLVTNIEDIIAKINSLKIKGVKFSLDDFGTGFSSLSYLKRLPLDQLKIDQSFVRDSLIDPSDAAIISAVITLGQSLGMDVIAEGVETEEQRNYLATQGCTHYQGYLFSKPLRLHEFETLLHNRFGSPKK